MWNALFTGKTFDIGNSNWRAHLPKQKKETNIITEYQHSFHCPALYYIMNYP